MKCNQGQCDEPAAYRFTWPGEDEAGICEAHAPKVRGVSEAMSLAVQLIPVEGDFTRDHGEETMTDTQHQENCDRLKECGKVISEIGEILSGCQDTAEARRVLVAAGLASGVMDVSDDYRIFYVREKKAEDIRVL